MDNIKTDLRETGWDDMDWIDLAQDRDQWSGWPLHIHVCVWFSLIHTRCDGY
jgi:hypothetical protein